MLLSNNEKSVVGTAIGRTVDGVAHVSSKVDVRLVYDQQLTRGVAASLSLLLRDNQFNAKRAIRINRSADNRFLKGIHEVHVMTQAFNQDQLQLVSPFGVE